MEDMITTIIELLIKILLAAVPIALTGFVFPWLTAHTNAQQQAEITRVVDTLVQTAEQLFGPGTGSQKLEAVQKWLAEKGIRVDAKDIEAAVLRLHAAGHDWITAHAQDPDLKLSANLPTPALAAKASASSMLDSE
jgi:hemerythrin